VSIGALFGLGGLPAQTRRGLAVASSTSIAVTPGVNLVYPLLPPMMGDLGLGNTTVGLVVTFFTLPAIFLAPVAGALGALSLLSVAQSAAVVRPRTPAPALVPA
jgi:hypothetical protein